MSNLFQEKVAFPPLHIKFGVMKELVKALDRNGQCSDHLQMSFPNLSEENIKAGIFDGPQIRKL